MNVPADDDTICARASAAGRGGITMIRVSGPAATDIARAMTGEVPAPRQALLRNFRDADGEPIDTGILLFFPAPHSFTGEDVVELQAHGGRMVCEMLLERLQQLGARPAEPGEFSRRAFLNDKLDLGQAEAIADLIDSESRAAARAAQRSLSGRFSELVMALNEQVTQLRVYVEAALDFPEEEVDFLDESELGQRLGVVGDAFDSLDASLRQGVLLRDGVHVVLAGRPNAGKSSVLNALAGYEAAIVTEVPGTTRDLVREQLDLDGLPLHIIDTAGLREQPDRVEAEGIRRARSQLATADHALLVVDATTPWRDTLAELVAELPDGLHYTVVVNKIDLTGDRPGSDAELANQVFVSARTRDGIDELSEQLKKRVGFDTPGEGTVIARQRHLDALRRAREHFETGCRQLKDHRAGELLAADLLEVQNTLAEITGEFTSDDLLGEIFSSFCIGK
ncbi:MAG: tRNA uridine-5-carboxymethylaminomethyl(34) synthesis GTPase MnmE [Chromatiales bacterium]|nr:MAG: tRNA uridine-5-carboxymethylaminomethyl(34) synthesis GTPase MnmE [Chromatiales bacterium]